MRVVGVDYVAMKSGSRMDDSDQLVINCLLSFGQPVRINVACIDWPGLLEFLNFDGGLMGSHHGDP